jgi:p-hydroxybenzoate 3-monooxygenase
MAPVRTQVGIVGAGPAGLLLGQLLHKHGISSVIIEHRDREHVIERVRAGVLEQGTVDLMHEIGVAERLDRQGLRHRGIHLAFEGRRHHVDFEALTGRAITVYGQNELVKDLIGAREKTSEPLFFNAREVTIGAFDSNAPWIRFTHDGQPVEIACDFIAGCDGFHGICRPAIPASAIHVYERVYPFAWLGILADAPPSSEELVYARHPNGFALFSMRSPEVTRLYLQCPPDDDIAGWSDDRIWHELTTRLTTRDGWSPNVGRITQKGITPMRSFVVEPMQHGRLFLAGDAAHIVPPTGAKGLNLAAADVWRLSGALGEFYGSGSRLGLDTYSERALQRVWWAQRFSWWMTSTLHPTGEPGSFDERRQLAELDYLVQSKAAMTSLAENYVGLPYATAT